METAAPNIPDVPLPRRTWRVWSWRTLAVVVATPFLVAAGLVVWMLVPRTTTETLPYGLYAGEVDGVPIVVEWPPHDPYFGSRRPSSELSIEELPDSVIGTGSFFAPEAARWCFAERDRGNQLQITNGSGETLLLERVAVYQETVTKRGATIGGRGRSNSSRLVTPAWIDSRDLPVSIVTEQQTGWSFLERRPLWEGSQDFLWSWTTRNIAALTPVGESRHIGVVTATPQVLTLMIDDDQDWDCYGELGLTVKTWYRHQQSADWEPVALERFFRPDSAWERRLDQQLEGTFQIRLKPRSDIDDPRVSRLVGVHYRQYPCVIAPGGLRLYSPWAHGEKKSKASLFISWSQLDDVLALDGPAAALRTGRGESSERGTE